MLRLVCYWRQAPHGITFTTPAACPLQGRLDQNKSLAVGMAQVDGELIPAHYLVELRSGGADLGALGRLEVAHLADHPAAEAALAEAIVAGSDLGPLLVLERLEV